MEEGSISFGSQFESIVHPRKAWQEDCGVAGHVVSAVSETNTPNTAKGRATAVDVVSTSDVPLE